MTSTGMVNSRTRLGLVHAPQTSMIGRLTAPVVMFDPNDETGGAGGAGEPAGSTPPATPAPETPPVPPATPPAEDGDVVAQIADMAKELGITPGQLKGRLEASKKWEQRAKKADEDAEAARLAALGDNEKAIEDAKNAGRAEAAQGFGAKLAAAKLEAALTGIVADPAEVIEDLNLTAFLTDTGDVDTDKVAALKAKYSAIAKAAPVGSADSGPQGAAPAVGDIDTQLAAARAAGDTKKAIALNSQKLAALAAKT